MTLRVVVDATAIPGRRVGAGIYVTELLHSVQDGDVDLHAFVNERDRTELGELLPRVTLHSVNARTRPSRIAWAQAVLPIRVRALKADVFHGPHYTIPGGLSCPSVVTFHDPTFFTHPSVHERAKVAYFTRAARTGIRRARRVIAVSEYAKRGAVAHAGADPEHVDVVLHGVDQERYRPADVSPVTPYILFVGALEPRKDVPTLIEAYADLVAQGKRHELTLCGLPAWGVEQIEAAIERTGLNTIRRTGYVTEDEKIELYRGASAFVYPSIAEGFGLPVLEAMASGAPTVTTTGSAPEEIAGDAAILVPPQQPAALCDAIGRILDDAGVAADLSRRGPERARSFTWERTASQTIEVWRRVAAGR